MATTLERGAGTGYTVRVNGRIAGEVFKVGESYWRPVAYAKGNYRLPVWLPSVLYRRLAVQAVERAFQKDQETKP